MGRFGQSDFVAYYLAALVVRLMTGAWVVWELNFEIRQGTLAFRLLRPIHPLVAYAAENVAAMPLRLAVSLPVALVALWILGGKHVTHDPLLLALFPVTVSRPGSSPSWPWPWSAAWPSGSTRPPPSSRSGSGSSAIFSGYLVPLELFPAWVAALARFLPFRYMLAFPVELVTGGLTRSQALAELGVQWLFVLLLLGTAAAVWRLGLRRFAAFGG